MRVKFTVIASIGAAFLFTVSASQDSVAGNISPAQLAKMDSARTAEPVHCRIWRHYHRGCSRGRCVRYYHRCGVRFAGKRP